jgi:hypothetical protein
VQGAEPQRRHDGAVGLDQVMLRQFVGKRPGERLGVERLRLAVVGRDPPDVEQHSPIRILVAQANERARLAHRHSELLGELALKASVRVFARTELAAREFPAPGHVTAARALRDQDAAVRIRDRARQRHEFRIDSPSVVRLQPRPGKSSLRRSAAPRGSA